MKTYVLVARHLGKVSGEKIYHYNKLKYLLNTGWRVLFLSSKEEKTPVDDYENYFHYAYPALSYAPECYTRREVRKTVDKMVSVIGAWGNERCIIESDSVNRAPWAEMIAKRIGAKHLALLLQEKHSYDEETRKYFRFKYDRHEIAGITEKSINQILGDERVKAREDTKIRAFCNNVVEDCEDIFSPQLIKDATYTFGSLGRLDKECVFSILDGFKAYALAYPGNQYNLVLIGGATGEKRIKSIRESVRECSNIHLIITGYLYPVPESLINNINLFVSTAGSTVVTYRYHRPTIKVHPITGDVVGIIGMDDFEGKTMYDVLPDMTVVDCIKRALDNIDNISYIYNYYEDYNQIMYEEFEREIAFADITKEKVYYDEEKLRHIKTSFIKSRLGHRLIGHFVGARGLNNVIGLAKRVKKV